MNTRLYSIAAAVVLSVAASQASTVHYVDLNSPNPTLPYLDWTSAATNIQDAIDAAVDGDQVLVTNGWYQAGGRVMAGDLTNRVALNKAVAVQSVNGPWVTTIAGAGATNGSAAVRCAWLTNGASLIGFRLLFGATRTSGDTTSLESGGGIWCASSNANVAYCLIVSNTAYLQGGGVFQGTVNNSLLTSNTLSFGNGNAAYGANLSSCTVVSNLGPFYAVYSSRLTNCLVYYNPNNGFVPVASYCCSTMSIVLGNGNFTTPPQLFADGVHLNGTSPCIGAGTNLTTGTDIFGRAWANPPSVGCAEWQPAPLVTQPQIQLTSDPVGFTVGKELIGGQPGSPCWWLKDNVALQDNGHFTGTQTTNLVATGIGFSDAGSYQLVVSNAYGMVISAAAQLVVHCVDVAGTNPAGPYFTWATAATNIQDAITAALPGEVVLVTNGIYATGGSSADGVSTNRVTVDRAIVVQSVNGPNATAIQGAWSPGTTNGPGAIRCAWMATNAVLSGFTLRGGATQSSSPSGGGVRGAGSPATTVPSATLVNCIITANSSSGVGAGAYLVKLNNCTLKANIAFGDGGGAYACNLKNCLITQNSSGGNGGGTAATYTIARSCAYTANSAWYNGGAAQSGTLVNCTISGNISSGYTAGYGGAIYGATLTNCIAWGNFQRTAYPYTNYASCTLAYCCADPLASGPGNIFADPQLLGDGFHLSATSPCRGAGLNSVIVGTDIDGQPWANPPAIGCDEWQPAPVLGVPPVLQINPAGHSLNLSAIAAGQAPFACAWTRDGAPVQDDGHYTNSGTTNLTVQALGPEHGGGYQVVVSNAFGMTTSQVTQVTIHAVDAASADPVPPYNSWATAATTIQAAIDGAAAGDIVLVTNGIYANGGRAMGDLVTNRITVDKELTVTSVNGCWPTVIQGAFDPATNGPAAVRCAWLTNGAVLNGFTLRNGATFFGLLQRGGGVWAADPSAVVSNCNLTNNSAGWYGGGMSGGTLNNSLVMGNLAFDGGGLYSTIVNNCTVVVNYVTAGGQGAGTYGCTVRNSIEGANFDVFLFTLKDDYGSSFAYSCLDSSYPGAGNIYGDAGFLDLFHISANSRCRGAGSALYAGGLDLDGEAWANPPSMGCDEVVPANLVGPLSVSLTGQTNLVVGHQGFLTGTITGRAAWTGWNFGDGPTITNSGSGAYHQWTNPGDYTVTFTAFNTDNPGGVSTSLVVHVLPLIPPQLQPPSVSNSSFAFQFTGQTNANYTVQYAPSLVPPVSWQTLTRFYFSGGQVYQIQDPLLTNGSRFYRVLAQ